jgi:hypothetical protein
VSDAQAIFSSNIMITLLKLAAAGALALSILSPGFTPRADNCECKAKANSAITRLSVPHADSCECKAKAGL